MNYDELNKVEIDKLVIKKLYEVNSSVYIRNISFAWRAVIQMNKRGFDISIDQDKDIFSVNFFKQDDEDCEVYGSASSNDIISAICISCLKTIEENDEQINTSKSITSTNRDI